MSNSSSNVVRIADKRVARASSGTSAQPSAQRSPVERHVPLILLSVFSIFWLIMAIEPVSRQDWLLENLLTIVLVAILIVKFARARLSTAAYGCIFILLVLHTLGSHYTYSLVPYDEWLQAFAGRRITDVLELKRNHYDRLVHFLYGVLMLLPSAEVLKHISSARGAGRWLLPLIFVMSQSATYELIEWAAASLVAPDLGAAYVGTQGDEWDCQKDMALAAGGAVLGLLIWRRRL